MKNILIFISAVSMAVVCCNNSKPSGKKSAQNSIPQFVSAFAGNWISKEYSDSLDSYGMPSRISVPATEICISFSSDSMCMFMIGIGRDVFSIAEKTDSSFRVYRFENESHTDFFLSPGGREIYYFDKPDNQRHAYFKVEPKYSVKVIGGWKSAFELFFNERMIADNYFLLNPENKPTVRVAFTSYGEIVGLSGYKTFSICYGETCRNRSPDDLITLSDGSIEENFTWNWKNDTMIFYSTIIVPVEKENEKFEKGQEIFRFIKSRR